MANYCVFTESEGLGAVLLGFLSLNTTPGIGHHVALDATVLRVNKVIHREVAAWQGRGELTPADCDAWLYVSGENSDG